MSSLIMLLKHKTASLGLLGAVLLLWHSSVLSESRAPAPQPPAVFDNRYIGAPPVAIDQTQVIYYRLSEGIQTKGAVRWSNDPGHLNG